MHRFYVPPSECLGPEIILTGSEAHHGLHVLRLRREEQVTVLNGAGTEFLCVVHNTTRDTIGLTVQQKTVHPPLPCQITLLQAVPKGKLIETIIAKATELGVWRIVPLLSARVILKLDDEQDAQRKAAKWQAVAIEAIKQCGAAYLPEVLPPQTPEEFLNRKEQINLALVGSLQPGSKHPRQYFDAYRARHKRNPASVSVWVGPEGDFTPEEYAAIEKSGASPITLGPLVLRSDTAAVYSLSILNYELRAALSH